jgi:hypothetical protein
LDWASNLPYICTVKQQQQKNNKAMNTSISHKALEVIKTLKAATDKSITGVSFVSIRNYTNTSGETSNNLINVGASYEKAKKSDIATLEDIPFIQSQTFKSTPENIEAARVALIAAFIAPDKARSEGQKDAYTHIVPGVKVHNETGQIYVYGYREKKEVLQAGEYKTVNSSALTIAKNELRKLLRTGKFTQYSLEMGNEIRANGQTLEL